MIRGKKPIAQILHAPATNGAPELPKSAVDWVAAWGEADLAARTRWPSLDAMLRAVAARDDGAGVYVVDPRGGQEFRSYAQILAHASRVGAGLQAKGVVAGERVMLVQSTGFDFLGAFFGAQAIGAVPIPYAPPRTVKRRRLPRKSRNGTSQPGFFDHAERLGARVILAERGVDLGKAARRLDAGRLKFCGGVSTLLDGVPGAAQATSPPAASDLAYIQLTAGATGPMRGVEISQANILANVFAIGRALRVSPDDVGVSWVPPYNSMGLVGIICFGLYWGLTMVMIHPERFLQHPEDWLRAISRHGGTLSVAPNFGYHYTLRRCQQSNLSGVDLSSWRVAMSGAEPVRAQHMDAFERRFSQYNLKHNLFLPVYGLAEATLAVTFGALDAPIVLDGINRRVLETQGIARPLPAQGAKSPAERLHLVSVGRPLEGVEVKIVGDDGQELPERACGEIWVRGPNRMKGYVEEDAPGASAPRRASRLEGDWLATGDLGYLADAQLYVLGRVCDAIKTARGRTHYPDEVELFVNSVDGIRVGSAVAFSVPAAQMHGEAQAPEQKGAAHADNGASLLVIGYELQAGTEQAHVERAVRTLLRKHLGIDPHTIVALSADSVPKTHSGKVRRFLARDLFLAERLDRRSRAEQRDPLRRVISRAQDSVNRLRVGVQQHLSGWFSDH